MRYIPQFQFKLEDFQTLFYNIYYRKMNSNFSAPSVSARIVIGSVIIKHMLNIAGKYVSQVFCWAKQFCYLRTLVLQEGVFHHTQ